ncbi:MAG: hypothetical protein VB111_03165 [Clostridiaceae bacterium]|nr:hypothetical protein [Clostridiaceae bacterium]
MCQCLKCAKDGGGCCLRHWGMECIWDDCPDYEPEKEITITEEEKA